MALSPHQKSCNRAGVTAAKALAAYRDSDMGNDRLHRKYMESLDKVAVACNAGSAANLSRENMDALFRESDKYRKVMRGPGCTR